MHIYLEINLNFIDNNYNGTTKQAHSKNSSRTVHSNTFWFFIYELANCNFSVNQNPCIPSKHTYIMIVSLAELFLKLFWKTGNFCNETANCHYLEFHFHCWVWLHFRMRKMWQAIRRFKPVNMTEFTSLLEAEPVSHSMHRTPTASLFFHFLNWLFFCAEKMSRIQLWWNIYDKNLMELPQTESFCRKIYGILTLIFWSLSIYYSCF